jgi:hypothetical protein
MKNKKGLTLGLLIDIGEGPHRLSLSHYCAYGSVHGGSVRNHDHDISARGRENRRKCWAAHGSLRSYGSASTAHARFLPSRVR